jgi:hypothetical protein
MVTLSPRRLAEQPLRRDCWRALVLVKFETRVSRGVPTYGLSVNAYGLGACRRHGAVTVQITSR